MLFTYKIKEHFSYALVIKKETASPNDNRNQ